MKEIASAIISEHYISHWGSYPWGDQILIMEKYGRAIGRIYRYKDDNTTVYLDMLSVEQPFRKKGIGTELQDMREKIGMQLGVKYSCLWVRKGTWMHDWYKRRGYVDFKNDNLERNKIWMKKVLLNNNQPNRRMEL